MIPVRLAVGVGEVIGGFEAEQVGRAAPVGSGEHPGRQVGDIGRRWERYADPLACAVISSVCAGYRQRHGYEAIGSPEPTRHHVIGFKWSVARRLPDDLDRLASRGVAVEPEADARSTAPVAAPGVTGLRKALWFVGRARVAARGRRRISLLTGHGEPTITRRLLVRIGVVREVRLEHFMSCDDADGAARRGSV